MKQLLLLICLLPFGYSAKAVPLISPPGANLDLPVVITDANGVDQQLCNASGITQSQDPGHNDFFLVKIQIPQPVVIDGCPGNGTETIVPAQWINQGSANQVLRVYSTAAYPNMPKITVEINGRVKVIPSVMPDPCKPNTRTWNCLSTLKYYTIPNVAVPGGPTLSFDSGIDPFMFTDRNGSNWVAFQCKSLHPSNPYPSGDPRHGQNVDTSSCIAPIDSLLPASTGFDLSRMTQIVTGSCNPVAGSCVDESSTWIPDSGQSCDRQGAPFYTINAAVPKVASITFGGVTKNYILYVQERFDENSDNGNGCGNKVWEPGLVTRMMEIALEQCPGNATKTCFGRAGQTVAYTTDSVDITKNVRICNVTTAAADITQDSSCAIAGLYVNNSGGDLIAMFSVGGDTDLRDDARCHAGQLADTPAGAVNYGCWRLAIRKTAHANLLTPDSFNGHDVNNYLLACNSITYNTVIHDHAGDLYMEGQVLGIPANMDEDHTTPRLPCDNNGTFYDLSGGRVTQTYPVTPSTWTFH